MRFELMLTISFLLMGNSYAAAGSNLTKVSQLIQRIGSEAGTPHIDVAIATPSEICYSSQFEKESGVTLPTLEDERAALFHSASISKLFTAVTIMQLRDEGALSLDDLVSKFVPAFAGSKIRLEHLLTHTSGLRDRKRANRRSTSEQVDAYISGLARQRVTSAPGTSWRYADAGFNLLGRVAENVTGKRFADVVRDRLLKPLGMENSGFDFSQMPKATLLAGFDKRGRQLKHPWDLAFLPSSGLQTNARDLARFAQAVLRANARSETEGVLRFDTLQEMVAVHVATKWNGVDQGYAWQILDSESQLVWRHAGGEAGFEGLFAIYPKSGVGIVALGNQKDWPRFLLVEQITKYLGSANTGLCSR